MLRTEKHFPSPAPWFMCIFLTMSNRERKTRMRFRAATFVLLLTSLLAAGTVPVRSQVNTEKLRRSDSTTGVFFTTSLSLGIVRGNSEYVSVSGGARLDWNRRGNDNFIVADYQFKESQKGKIANKGFVHLRSIWELSALLSLEGFTQAQFNEFISLKNRDLIGAGARLHLLEATTEEDHDSFSLFCGIGAMFEHEQYDTRPEDTRFNRIRSTNYLTLNWLPKDGVSWSLVTYVQPLIAEPEDYRVTAESSLEFALTEHFGFHVNASWRYHSRPVLAIKRYDLEIRNGITVSLP